MAASVRPSSAASGSRAVGSAVSGAARASSSACASAASSAAASPAGWASSARLAAAGSGSGAAVSSGVWALSAAAADSSAALASGVSSGVCSAACTAGWYTVRVASCSASCRPSCIESAARTPTWVFQAEKPVPTLAAPSSRTAAAASAPVRMCVRLFMRPLFWFPVHGQKPGRPFPPWGSALSGLCGSSSFCLIQEWLWLTSGAASTSSCT